MCASGPTTSQVLPSRKVVTRRTVYHRSVCVDLRAVRSVHALEHCPCIIDPKLVGNLNGNDCGSVHYGLCSPLTLPPVVNIPVLPSSPTQSAHTLTPIVAKSESFRDKIQAAIELLAVEEEPADLETLLRNFVIEDRRRQEARQSSAATLDSKTGKKIIIRSHSQIDVLNNYRNDVTVDGSTTLPNDGLSSSLVRSRLSKFDTDRSRSLSPSPSTNRSTQRQHLTGPPSVESLQLSESLSSSSSSPTSQSSSAEKVIFGISPKSNSLSRYKTLIESRRYEPSSSSSSSQSSSITTSPINSQLFSELEDNELLTTGADRQQQRHQTIHVRPYMRDSNNTPVGGVVTKIDGLLSAQSPTNVSFVSVPEREPTSARTPSVVDSKSKSNSGQITASYSLSSYEPQTVSQASVVASNVQMSPSPVKSVSTSAKKTPTTGKLLNTTDSRNGKNGVKARPLSAPEPTLEDIFVQQLTDDEKAILQKNSRISGAKDGQLVMDNNNTINDKLSVGLNGNGLKSKPVIDKPKPRIITLSKPLPKPEPKAPEPKCVNGKLVFGQIPVKPVLSKGSVAERVLLFEKCPEKTSVTKVKVSDKTREKITYNKVGQWMKLNDNNNNNNNTNNNNITNKQNDIIGRRFSRSNSLTSTPAGQLPKFYYPVGRPYSSHEVETQIRKITSVFDRFPTRIVGRKELAAILKLVGLPLYWKEPVFRAVNKAANTNGNKNINNNNNNNGNGKKELITCEAFVDYWKKLISTCYDNTSRFFKIMTGGQRNYLLPEDFVPMLQDVIDTHPGLAFLKEAEEFHSRYVHTVIARIYYCVNKSWTGRITLPELKKSNFIQVLSLLEEEDDINQITDYFSYEHFYVIYCKFWELDKDHDLFISKTDLSRHNDSAISSRMIDRIFSGAVTRGDTRKDGLLSYSEFVWFLLSEEDKRHPRSIEYWFRCMDLDGDGYLSMYELEYFYSEQTKRMEAIGIEALPFNDCLCQMLDLVRPKHCGQISLSDLKRCRLTPIFFDTFFNLEKYLDHEQRDPFASSRDEDGLTMSDWDRFAAEEYELLVAEESVQQTNQNLLDFTGETVITGDYTTRGGNSGSRYTSQPPDYESDYCDPQDDSDLV